MPYILFSQKQGQAKIDSLLKCFSSEKNSLKKITLLDDIAIDYRLINPDEGINYAQRGLELAEQLDYGEGVALSYGAMGANYQYKSDYPNAFEYDMKALRKFEEIGDKRGMASAYRNIGNVYQYEKNYSRVLEYHFKALKLNEELNDTAGIAANFTNIGIFYFSQNDYDKALAYNLKALKINEAKDHLKGAENLSNIGDIYMHKNEYASALQYDFKALAYFKELGDKYGAAITLGNAGEAYLAIAKDKSADASPTIRKVNLTKAIIYLQQAIDTSKKIDQPDNIIEFSEYLSEAYELSDNYKDALKSYKDFATMNDSVYSSQNNSKIKRTEQEHDLELKDRDIKLAQLAVAKKKNEQVFFIASIISLLMVIAIVLRNSNIQRKTNKLLSREKKRSDDLLLNILPAEVADELKEKGSAAAKYFDNVTVMFTDFVDFTKAGEKMTPQQLVDELHNCFKAFDEIMRKYGIEKIKTIGDAYMAATGLPVADPNHAITMVKAAIAIRDFMKERKKQLGDNTFEVRIGMHSGNIVAGIVGVIKFAYDIWGDTVNTAARMEEQSEPGKINISQTTYELVKNNFECSYRGGIEAKNKGTLSMYFIND